MADRELLKLARQKLSANNLESGLPGREDQYDHIFNFLYERLKVKVLSPAKKIKTNLSTVLHKNQTIFICGVPGTGKTATVMSVVETLEKFMSSTTGKKSKTGDSQIHPFKLIQINGLQLTQPDKIYSEMLNQMTGEKLGPDRAQDRLNKIFISDEGISSKRKSKKSATDVRDYTLLLLDELDTLYSERRQSIFYNLFEWPALATSRLIVIAIANAMDLPEKFMSAKVMSRVGWEKVIFETYTSDGLEKIVTSRLGRKLMAKCFDNKAIILATKRIGRTSGDARRILDTCRMAIDLAIDKNMTQVTPSLVDQVASQGFDQHRWSALDSCTNIQKIILRSILKEADRLGTDNVKAIGVHVQFMHMIEKFPFLLKPNIDRFQKAVYDLAAQSLIYMQTDRPFLESKMFIKNISDSITDVILNFVIEPPEKPKLPVKYKCDK